MARRSTRIASSQGSQASSSPPAPSNSPPRATAKKRKAESGESPSAKRGKQAPKEQKTIEESMDVDKYVTERMSFNPAIANKHQR